MLAGSETDHAHRGFPTRRDFGIEKAHWIALLDSIGLFSPSSLLLLSHSHTPSSTDLFPQPTPIASGGSHHSSSGVPEMCFWNQADLAVNDSLEPASIFGRADNPDVLSRFKAELVRVLGLVSARCSPDLCGERHQMCLGDQACHRRAFHVRHSLAALQPRGQKPQHRITIARAR